MNQNEVPVQALAPKQYRDRAVGGGTISTRLPDISFRFYPCRTIKQPVKFVSSMSSGFDYVSQQHFATRDLDLDFWKMRKSILKRSAGSEGILTEEPQLHQILARSGGYAASIT